MIKKFLEQKNIFLLSTLLLFAVIYCSISIVNHFQLRTFALDLGVYNHALYSFANFQSANFTLGIDGIEMPFFGTHFAPIMLLYVPFYYIFGSYTLLLIQIVAVLSGGVAIYKLSSEYFPENSIIPKIILIQFLSIWGIYSALSFDFHNNVIASMLVIWFVYFLEKRRYWFGIIMWLLILISQENMALWMIFILLGLMIKNRKESSGILKVMASLLVLSIFYTICIIEFVMPALQGVGNNLQLQRYAPLGGSLHEMVLIFFTKPLYVLGLLFNNIFNDPVYDGIKLELHFMVLVSGGICLFLRPVYLIMLIPIYAQKLFSNDYSLWGLNHQYSIEFVPIISLAFLDFLKRLKRYRYHFALAITVLTIIFNINSINHRKSKWYNKENTVFYSVRHYKPKLDLKVIKNALQLIDQDASVSASSVLVPRLAFREKIYHFPIIKDAKYIALVKQKRGTYPLSKEDFNNQMQELMSSQEFSVLYENQELLILLRD